MIIDAHAHLWRTEAEEDKRKILQAAEHFGISKVIVSTLDSCIPDQEEIIENNQLTWSFIKEEPDLVRGYCYLNPSNAGTMTELRRCVEDRGFCGVKFWISTFCDDPAVNPIVEQCIRYRIPILVHAFHKSVNQLPFESLGQNVRNLAERYPEARLLMAHLGGNCLRELRYIKKCANVWVDFSGSVNHSDDLAYAEKIVGSNRLIFGSDMPGADFMISYAQVLESDFAAEEREKFLYQNAEQLFRGRL